MSFNSSTITKLAASAHLEMGSCEASKKMIERVEAVMNEIKILLSIETALIEPLIHPLESAQRLRADKINETNQLSALKTVAPNFANNLFLVPQVIHSGN